MTELLKIEGLSKSYSKSLKASMKYASLDLLKGSFGLSTERKTLRDLEFWALRDINLNLYRGEVLGVLGHNGAGKSTLLKCIANKIQPTTGRISLKGTLGHMIEMSAGFDGSLTGRENVSLRGSILGFKGKALHKYIDSVRDFAEIDDFFDAPVQFYSSGMKSRLGFAASSAIEPDILIIDEVLAVGDLNFRLKCYERMNELAKKSAVIFVSHSIGQLSRMCTRAIYLEKGKVLLDGEVKEALAIYQDKIDLAAKNKKNATLNPELIRFRIEINNCELDPETKTNYGDRITVHIDVSKINQNARIRIIMRDASGSVLQDWNSVRTSIQFPGSTNTVMIDLGSVELAPGTYSISIEVTSINGVEHFCLSDAKLFRVVGEYYAPIAIQRQAEWKFV